MAAYNRGSNGISSDMAYQYQNNYYDLYLNNETYRYVFRILAMKEIFENLEQYFDISKWGSQYQLPETQKITLGKTDNLAAWATANGYTYLEVRNLNPWIRANKLPEGSWTIEVYKRQFLAIQSQKKGENQIFFLFVYMKIKKKLSNIESFFSFFWSSLQSIIEIGEFLDFLEVFSVSDMIEV